MPNFSIALTGLQADTVALNTIGNNLANLNTTAFKKQDTTFEDLFYQQMGTTGSGDPVQVGVGTRVSGTRSDFGQGTLTPDSTPTDMALGGAGFFLVQNGKNQLLTRAGNFSLDATGNLITSSGENVMGFGATNGAVDLNGGLVPINIPTTSTEGAVATQNVTLTTSLDASASTGASFPSSVTLYDSLGASHLATVTYTKTSPTTWGYSIALPAGDATGATANTSGTLTFDSTGKMIAPTGNVGGVSFAGMTDGASDLNFSFNLYDHNNNPVVTETATPSNTATTSQDGYSSGVYQSFTVDGAGVISALFSNNHTVIVGQVAVATVTAPEALIRSGGNDFMATGASGAITVGAGNTGGRGEVVSESLEQSNVDISSEFSNLIIAQRAFEANSKTVTTFDTVTQEAIALIR